MYNYIWSKHFSNVSVQAYLCICLFIHIYFFKYFLAQGEMVPALESDDDEFIEFERKRLQGMFLKNNFDHLHFEYLLLLI